MQQDTADIADFAPPRAAQEPSSRRFRTLRVIMALVMRDIGSKDSRSQLGFLWQVIDPIATVMILAIVFSLLTKTPRLGTNFPLYYLTGHMAFHIYSGNASRVSAAVRQSRQLLGFPSVKVLDVLFARFLLNYLINLFVFAVVAIGVIEYYDLRVDVDMIEVSKALAMGAALALGVGTFNSVLFIMFPTYEHFWGMLSRPMTIASGVLILIDDLPEWVFHILWWNPAAHVVAQMRGGFYSYYDIPWVSPLYVFGVSGILFVLGLISLQRFVYDALDR
jgi:capsular polysaccharide transport system permease protein